jgi:dTDP-4-dehydrorhamnose 3,5-epimerase-like enzyme
MSACHLIDLPRVLDRRGNLTYVEGGNHLPFDIARAYWIHEVPGGAVRGGHAYRSLQECFVALSGSFDVVADDGVRTSRFPLNRSYTGLYVPPVMWRSLENFSTNAVCLILASQHYDERDYLRDHAEFLALRASS